MSRALSPNFTLPPLSVAPSGRGRSLSSLVASNEDLVSLSLSTLADGRFDERVDALVLESWYHAAARAGATLVVIRTGAVLELYSTQRDYSAACGRSLRTVAEWSRQSPELCQFHVVFRRGDSVARHLFARVAGIASSSQESVVDAFQLERTMSLAKRTGALSHTTASLLRVAQRVARRVASETLEGDVAPTEVLREMAVRCAERIVEEELLLWKAEQAELYRALARMGSPVVC